MLAYILRRILLMIPTIFGIMLVSFVIVQFVPGGPVERAIAQLQGADQGTTAGVGGTGGQIGASGMQAGGDISSRYRGAQGLDPKFIKELEKQYGFDKPALRALLDSGARLRDLQFRQELLSRRAGARPHQGEAAGLDLARPVDDADLLCDLDPARHPQGGAGRLALRHLDLGARHLRLRDPELPVRDPADRAVLRRLVLADFPAARPDLGQLGRPRLASARSSTISGTSRCR